MEFLPILVLLLLAFPIIAIVALVKASNVSHRMRQIEERFLALERRIAGAPIAAAAAPLHGAAAPPPPPPPVEAPQPVEDVPPRFRDEAKTPEPAMAAEGAPDMAPPAPSSVAPKAPAPSLEERFGTRWVVWVGGLALALGGIFLVRYSIEQGLIGPGVRVLLGALLAAGLVAAGEWLRRQENISGIAGLPSAHIPSILTAAGTTVAYATVYASYELYGFLSPAVAFILLGVVALATLAAALLHGPALAALGLVGAYVTPLLVSTATPNYWALYLYLAVVSAAAFALARMRLWRWLAITAVAFGFFWIFPGLENVRFGVTLSAHEFHAVAGFALVAALIVCGLFYGPPAEPGKIDKISSLSIGIYLLAMTLVAIASRHDPEALTVFTVLVVATLAIAWRTEAAAAAVPVAAAAAMLVIIRWVFDADLSRMIAPAGLAGVGSPQPLRAGVGVYLTLGGAYGALFAAAGFFAQGRSIASRVPILWSASGVLAPIVILIALYYRVAGVERSIPFAFIALLLAALFSYATEHLWKRDPRPGLATSGAFYATGAVAALALALTFALEKGWLTIALALMVPGIAWISEKRPVPMLRWLAGALVVLVMARIFYEPRIVGDDVGTTPIFNWLLWGYGIPAAAFWFGGYVLRKRADDLPSRMVDSAAILFTVLLAVLEIRHFMNDGDVYRSSGGLAELAVQVCVGLAMAIGLEHVRERTGSVVHNVGAQLVAVATLFAIVFGLGFAANPLVTGDPVGGLVFNNILLGYGLPAVLAIVLALRTRGRRPNGYRICAAAIAVILALSYLSLEVTTFYHGPVLTRGPTTNAEQYTYSVVWLMFGVVLLIAGIFLRSTPARLASAAIVALTVAKVFLIDVWSITGIFRALSFIGLGLVVVGIGLLYQRLLFPQRAAAAGAPTGAPPAT
jgi:uncharacterized membrane protein